eukprot:Amastigsp_a176730_141.p3 type:complete len:112 gc:universal Amastigsp_a176730_141:933-598(-)
MQSTMSSPLRAQQSVARSPTRSSPTSPRTSTGPSRTLAGRRCCSLQTTESIRCVNSAAGRCRSLCSSICVHCRRRSRPTSAATRCFSCSSALATARASPRATLPNRSRGLR